MRQFLRALPVLFAAALVGQSPTPPANAQIPGTNLFRCATPSNAVGGASIDHPDCDFFNTNPTAAYAPGTVIGIPVVVHVIQTTGGQGFLSDALVQSQIAVLNEDFRALAGTPGQNGVDTRIQFFLATVDPQGNPTTGIRRHTNNTWFQDAGSYWNSIAWPTQRYLNIYTNNCGNGSILGYVPDLPQSGAVLNTNADRVVILYSVFGRPGLSGAPFNQGRTCTHEVGHYLGLFHTFENGCGSAACYQSGDRICDTNAEANPRFGCPTSAVSCGTPDPVRNYMDYTDDSCMTNFTQEQARRMRCTLQHYRPLLDQQVAAATAYGSGCYTTRASFSQTFPPSGFDLAGTASTSNVIAFAPTLNGYTIQPGVDAWFTPVAPSLGLGDEALATNTLPFVFPFPGGSTNVVRMCSNGYVWLDGVTATIDRTPSVLDLANQVARFAPLWLDLDPAAGGSTHFDVDPAGNAVYCTWLDVPAFAPGAPGPGNSFQLVLRADGSVEYRYRQVPNQPALAVVGWSRGATLLPTNTDISTALPFVVGLDLNPLSWTASNRPVIGTTQQIAMGNISGLGAAIGVTMVGFSAIPAGTNLAFLGAPGCFLHVNAAVLEAWVPVGASYTWQLPIPANPALSGAHVFTQGALLRSGVNAFGALTSNALDLTIGTL